MVTFFLNKIFCSNFEITPPYHLKVLISTDCIESLIPEFLMESGHFFLFVADVEGKVLRFNKGFERIHGNPQDLSFSKFLSSNSEEEFHYSMDLMLGSPKIRRHLMLDHPGLQHEGFLQVWWEFSVVTTPDMDISGIIGIGVGMQFLEQEMPWNSLVDVLGFGEIVLDNDLKVESWDARIENWFDPKLEKWQNSYLLDVPTFRAMHQLPEMLSQVLLGKKPRCFLISSDQSVKNTFASLMTVSSKGYHLFLMPKKNPLHSLPELSLIPSRILELFEEPVMVLNPDGILLQQNERAKKLGKTWNGRPFSEGFLFTFPGQANRYSKLTHALREARQGNSTELELKIQLPEQELTWWKVKVKPIPAEHFHSEGVLVEVQDVTASKIQLNRLNQENSRIKELAVLPSHILRGPLSSIMGIVELIDSKPLDPEDQKLFGHLKPLTKALDHAIRQHTKKMSTLD